MKKIMPELLKVLYGVMCVLIVIAAVTCSQGLVSIENKKDKLQVITVWQIDSFEGGKGSRAEYLRSLGNKFAENNNVFINVITLTADAARVNIDNDIIPDVISYGAGMYGLESIINDKFNTYVWCRGGYCLLSIVTDDFSKANSANTIINSGKENLSSVAALFMGLENSDVKEPVAAYVELLNGNYDFLLGTQRDIVRLQTRGVNFYVYPVTVFNDLYQYISVTTYGQKEDICYKYLDYLTGQGENLSSLRLFYDGIKLYDNQLGLMENLSFEYSVPAVVSQSWKDNILKAIEDNNIDMLKSLL